MLNQELCSILLGILSFYVGWRLTKFFIFPKLLEKTTKEIEKNPKWIMSEIKSKVYGFQDIDIIIVTSVLGALPRFRITKDNKYQLLISDEFTTKDVNTLARIALTGKIKVKYGLLYPDKPLEWLSTLCYMLDGGEFIKEVK